MNWKPLTSVFCTSLGALKQTHPRLRLGGGQNPDPFVRALPQCVYWQTISTLQILSSSLKRIFEYTKLPIARERFFKYYSAVKRGVLDMSQIYSLVRTFDVRLLGTCAKCARISFGVSAASWILLSLAALAGLHINMLFFLGSIVLTALWIGHILARAVRATPPQFESRRAALTRFALAIGGAAVTSLLLSIPAHADSGCGGWAGNSGCDPCPEGNCYRQRTDCSCWKDTGCGSHC